MAYTKQTWENLPSQTTPINADRLTHIEDGIYDAANTADTAASDASSAISGLADKVDKVEGKGLSTNDFTDALKTKLDNIETGAEVNVQSDWNQSDNSADDYIKNKPSLGTSAYKNSTSVVTDSSDVVESGAVYDVIGWGNKNLLPVPYTTGSVTKNGITWTVNSDGSVTANGTATANSTFSLYQKEDINFSGLKLSGCPNGGSDSTYFVGVALYNSPYTRLANDFGEGADIPNYTQKVMVFIRVSNGATVSNLTFYPMVSKDGGAYEPYHTSVEDTLRDAEVVEGKNKLPYPFYETGTKTEHNISIVNNGDGTLSIGTSAQTDARVLYGLTGIGATTRRPISDIINKILVLNATGNNFGLYLWYYNGLTYLSAEYISSDKAPTIPNNCDSYVLFAQVPSGTTPTGTIKPMIVDATETDYSYEPYYTPLKDVVPNKADNTVIAPTENVSTASQAYAVGSHFIRNGAFCTVTTAISSGESLVGSNKFTSDTVEGNLVFKTYITSTSDNLNNYTTKGVYVVNANCSNVPENKGFGLLFVADIAPNDTSNMLQIYFTAYSNEAQIYLRRRSQDTWRSWYKVSGTAV